MERRSKSILEWLLVAAMLTAQLARADDDTQEAFRDIGAVLGWRLAPEAVEERCHAVDPDGTDVRKKALAEWLRKNQARIELVDSRVAEVVPLLIDGQETDTAIRAVREQVRKMLLEPVSLESCKAVADPTDTLWTSNGVPQVPESLAALYDWKVRHTRIEEKN
jgi:hypothetical protein